LSPETCSGGKLSTIEDQAKPTRMVNRWPTICSFFGLEGVGPLDDRMGALLPGKYDDRNRGVLKKIGMKGVEVCKGEFLG